MAQPLEQAGLLAPRANRAAVEADPVRRRRCGVPYVMAGRIGVRIAAAASTAIVIFDSTLPI